LIKSSSLSRLFFKYHVPMGDLVKGHEMAMQRA
jgi:hypothetical protein